MSGVSQTNSPETNLFDGLPTSRTRPGSGRRSAIRERWNLCFPSKSATTTSSAPRTPFRSSSDSDLSSDLEPLQERQPRAVGQVSGKRLWKRVTVERWGLSSILARSATNPEDVLTPAASTDDEVDPRTDRQHASGAPALREDDAPPVLARVGVANLAGAAVPRCDRPLCGRKLLPDDLRNPAFRWSQNRLRRN